MDKQQCIIESESESETNKSRVKSNSINTLRKFYKPGIELVNTLDFRSMLIRKKDQRFKMKNKSVVEKLKEDKYFKRNMFEELVNMKKPFLNTFIEERLENMSIENDLEKKIKNLEKNINEIEFDMTKIMDSITLIKKNIDDKTIMIECYANLDTIDNEKNVQNSPIKKRKISDDKIFLIRKISLSRERECEEFKDDIMKFKLMKQNKIDDYNELEKKLNIKKQDLKTNKIKLMNHYHNLLYEGKDTRKEGLSWIIKAIWKLGFEVIMSSMPNYLDEECIRFLFQYSKKDIELSQIKEKIEDLKVMIQSLKYKNKVYKTETRVKRIYNENIQRRKSILPKVKEIFKNEIDRYIDNGGHLTVNKFQNLIPNFKNFDDETKNIFKAINILEEQHENIKKTMLEMRTNLLDKINRDFLINDYGRRFNISLEGLITALVGEESFIPEMVRQMKLKRDYYKNIDKCRTFNVVNLNNYQKKKYKFDTSINDYTIS